VVFNDVLEHIVDPWASLRLARRHVAPGGVVVASIPNLLHQHNLQHLLLERDFKYEDNGIRDRTHLRFFTRRSMLRMFEESGWRVARIAGINASWWSNSLLLRLAYRILDRQLEETKYIQFAVVTEPLA
jgi:2-polyprenyl-3-methyl-5-hydroxy-6-metoxy-1,4-benzoquinol methylase